MGVSGEKRDRIFIVLPIFFLAATSEIWSTVLSISSVRSKGMFSKDVLFDSSFEKSYGMARHTDHISKKLDYVPRHCG